MQGTVLLTLHNIFPEFVAGDQGEVLGHESIIDRCQCDGERGGDDDVGAAGDEPRRQVVQVVTEAGLHDGLERLLGQHDCIFIIAVPLDLLDLLHLIVSLELEGAVLDRNVALLFLALVDVMLMLVLRCRNERINLVKMLLLIEQDTPFKDLVHRGGAVGNARVDDHLLVGAEELLGVDQVVWVEVRAVNTIVDLLLLNTVLDCRGHLGSIRIVSIRKHGALRLSITLGSDATLFSGGNIQRQAGLLLQLARTFLIIGPSLKATEDIKLFGEAGVGAEVRGLTVVHSRLVLEVSG